IAVHAREITDLRLLLAERFHDSDAGEVLLRLGREVTELRLKSLEPHMHIASDPPERDRRKRHEDHRDDRQLHGHAEHREQREDERHHREGALHERRPVHLTDRREVVRHARHQVTNALVLEVREMHLLQMREEIVPHLVLGLASEIQQEIARDPAEDRLSRRERDGREGEEHHDLERCPVLERVDDRADEARRNDAGERRRGGTHDADHELELPLAEVVEEGRAGGRHSLASLAFCLRISRVDLPPIHTMATMPANPTKTGATPHRSAIGPTTTRGTRLKIETSMLRKPKTRPRIASGSSSWRSVIEGTVMNAYDTPKTNAVPATTATKTGKAAPSPGEPAREKRSARGRAAARNRSADSATIRPGPIAFGRAHRRP